MSKLKFMLLGMVKFYGALIGMALLTLATSHLSCWLLWNDPGDSWKYVLANNDGPLGQQIAAKAQWPSAAFGSWDDLNGIGMPGMPTPALSIDAAIRSALTKYGIPTVLAWLLGVVTFYWWLRAFKGNDSKRASRSTAGASLLVCSLILFIAIVFIVCTDDAELAQNTVQFGGVLVITHGCWILGAE